MEITQELLDEIKSCCHNGHGASVFANGDVYQAISSNDVLARQSSDGGWEYRVAYIDDPDIDEDALDYLLNQDF